MKLGIQHLALSLFLGPLTHESPPSVINPPFSTEDRANQLLLQHFNPCNLNTRLPRNCFETVASVSGMDDFRAFRQDGIVSFRFHELLINHGFQRISTFAPFSQACYTTGETRPSSINTSSIPTDLHRGDILAFVGNISENSPENDPYNPRYLYVHAVVYLGGGMVFEKMDFLCGDKSPYHTISLTAILQRTLGKPYNEDSSYRDILVFRRS